MGGAESCCVICCNGRQMSYCSDLCACTQLKSFLPHRIDLKPTTILRPYQVSFFTCWCVVCNGGSPLLRRRACVRCLVTGEPGQESSYCRVVRTISLSSYVYTYTHYVQGTILTHVCTLTHTWMVPLPFVMSLRDYTFHTHMMQGVTYTNMYL